MNSEGTKSIKKIDLTTDKNLVIGTKNLKIHHEATLGDTLIDLTNLIVPSGFTNPSPTEISNMRLKDFSSNWILTSNLRSLWIEKASYEIVSNTRIRLKTGYEALDGEVFIIQYFNYATNGTVIADVRETGGTGTLLEGERDFNLGEAVPIKDLANQFPISVIRGKRRVEARRNQTNSEYAVPAIPLSADIYSLFKIKDSSIEVSGNGGEAVSSGVTDITFGAAIDGWSGNSYTVKKQNSKITITGLAFFTTAAGRSIDLYIGGVLFQKISAEMAQTASTVKFHFESEDLNKDDVLSLRTNANSTLSNNNILHYIKIFEESDIDDFPSEGDYQMLDRGDGYCQVIRFNVAGGVGGEEISWANHGALAERPNLSTLQRVDKIHGIVDKMREDMYAVTGNDVADPTRYDEGVPTQSDLMAFGNLLTSILNIEVMPDENTFSAYINSAGVVSGENIDFIEGDAVISDTSLFTINFKSGWFSDNPNAVATIVTATGASASAKIESISSTQIVVRTSYPSATVTYNKNPYNFMIVVHRSGTDYKPKKKIRDLI